MAWMLAMWWVSVVQQRSVRSARPVEAEIRRRRKEAMKFCMMRGGIIVVDRVDRG